MFSGGPELFSVNAFRGSSTTTPKSTDGETPVESSSATSLTEDELEERAGRQMMAARKHQNEQMRKAAKKD